MADTAESSSLEQTWLVLAVDCFGIFSISDIGGVKRYRGEMKERSNEHDPD